MLFEAHLCHHGREMVEATGVEPAFVVYDSSKRGPHGGPYRNRTGYSTIRRSPNSLTRPLTRKANVGDSLSASLDLIAQAARLVGKGTTYSKGVEPFSFGSPPNAFASLRINGPDLSNRPISPTLDQLRVVRSPCRWTGRAPLFKQPGAGFL